MLDSTDDISIATENWLAQFEGALAKSDDGLLKNLFHPDSHWRDVLALTWRFTTIGGRDAILAGLQAHGSRARPSGFGLDPDPAAPRSVSRAGVQAIESIFRFETTEGRGSGILRLTTD